MFGRGSHNEKAQHATTRRIAGFGYRNEQKFHLFTWLRLHGVDLITMAMAGGAALGVHYARKFRYSTGCGVLQTLFSTCVPPLLRDSVPGWRNYLRMFTSIRIQQEWA